MATWRAPVLSGVLLGLSYCFPLFVTNFVALVPLLFWIEANARQPPGARKKGWAAGWMFGWATHLVTLHWIYVLAVWTWLAYLLYVLFAAALALRIMVSIRWLVALRNRWSLPYALLLPLVWIPLEWLQSFGDLRMTGEHLAHSLSRYPFLVQFADLVGPFGVGAFMLAINGWIVDVCLGWARARNGGSLPQWLVVEPLAPTELPTQEVSEGGTSKAPNESTAGKASTESYAPSVPGMAWRKRLAIGMSCIALILVYDAWRWWTPAQSVGALKVGIVQPNVPLDAKMQSDKTAVEQVASLQRATQQLAASGAELVVWPETARPYPLYHWDGQDTTFEMPEVSSLARSSATAILVGVEYLQVRSAQDYDLYNAAIMVHPDGSLNPDWSAKRFLVPFVEQMPFRSLLAPLIEGRGGEWNWLAGSFAVGPQRVMQLEGAPIGVLVCYEQLFADLANELNRQGAQVQVVITNDAWFGRSLFQNFQANALRLRAIENRREMVRTANTGISGFVDRWGRYREKSALFEETTRITDVPLYSDLTLFNRIGNVVAWLLALGLAFVTLLGRRRAVIQG